MTMKRSGLGRNLSALLGASSAGNISLSPPGQTSASVGVQQLQPGKYQPRTTIDDQSLQELAGSIRQQGLLQPLLARPIGADRYEILAGERRWRACQLAGLTSVPIIIHDVDNETAMAIALVENLQREDLNPVDQARAMARLTEEFSLTHHEVAELLSKSRSAISNYLRLLGLPNDVLNLLELGDIDMGHARALLTLENEQMIEVARLVIAKELTVRETEKLVNRIKANLPVEEHANDTTIHPLMNHYRDHLTAFLDTKISIKTKKNGGSVVIHYRTADDLEQIVNKIKLYQTTE